ncbi:hypothetical protein RchiOBHm_Chr1g0330981 [Rosa chinensis]|uniref:Uncharacterized protein n=1 Tax=Rosa chinensis TaxID=74649 RepID=A0A2P6SBF8_ROSCH|nr:hypothetical protein RchiOBHm_Chr1g0330981 [Rosa chinensis]
MSISPPVKRKVVFSDQEEDIDHNPFPSLEMSVSAFSSTPLLPKLMNLKLQPKANQLSPRSPINPLYDHIGFEVSPFPQLRRRSTATLNGGQESFINHRLHSTLNKNGALAGDDCFSSLPKRDGVSKEPMNTTSPLGNLVISTERKAPKILFPNPTTGEGYPDVPGTQSPEPVGNWRF